MPKKVITIIKLQIPAGKASPAPPVGPALGQHGLNIQDFCTRFNEATKNKGDNIIPVEISVFEDRSFDFVLKKPPVAEYLKKALKLKKGSQKPGKEMVATITQKQLADIAQEKMADLNTDNLKASKKIVAGSARSMGIKIGK